jgi:hypothetical protein
MYPAWGFFCGEGCLSPSINKIVEGRGFSATPAIDRRPVMADRTPIFGTKAAKSQIGYIENGGAFDLSGRRRCNYNAATGNLSDPVTEKIVGYVSLDGNFVVPSRIADELFEQPGDREASTPSSTAEGEPEEYATKSNRPQALDEPTDAFLERANEMIQNFKKETS